MDNTNHRLPTGLELDGITNKSFDGDWVSEKRDDRRKSLSHFFRLIHGLTFISYIMLSIYLYIYTPKYTRLLYGIVCFKKKSFCWFSLQLTLFCRSHFLCRRGSWGSMYFVAPEAPGQIPREAAPNGRFLFGNVWELTKDPDFSARFRRVMNNGNDLAILEWTCAIT